jgi:imidazolonepropionase-like amidohydrolase
MKYALLFRGSLLAALAAPAIAVSSTRPPNLSSTGCVALTHVAVVDPSGTAARPVTPGQTVVICGDRIRSISSSADTHPPKGAHVVTAAGKYLIPGLWDMHVHFVAAGEASAPQFLLHGVTGVRDCGSPLALIRSVRAKISSGVLAGPRIKASGPVLESQRFLDVIQQISPKLPPDLARSLSEVVHDRIGLKASADAQPQVDKLKTSGVDFIKVRNSDSPDVLYAIAEAARRDGLPLAGHVIRGVNLARASTSGQTSFEHDEDYFDSDPPPAGVEEQAALAAVFVRGGSVLVPTIVTGRSRLASDAELQAALDDTVGATDPMLRYLPAELLQFWKIAIALGKLEEREESWDKKLQRGRNFVHAMHKYGVQILPGTDLGVPLIYPGESLLDELQILVDDIGMTPREALESATTLSAHWFAMQDRLGTIAVGKIADLVLLEANPLDDIRNTRRISAVIANGKVYDRAELEGLVADWASAAVNRPSPKASHVAAGVSYLAAHELR